jgi:hypothetical protein
MNAAIKKAITYAMPIMLTLGACGMADAKKKEKFPSYKEAQKVLGVSSLNQVARIPSNYFTTKAGETSMYLLAGIYAGTVKVKKTMDGDIAKYSSRGSYAWIQNPEAMDNAAKDADVNNDRILTKDEIENLEIKVFREAANK